MAFFTRSALELDPWLDAIRMQETRQTEGQIRQRPQQGGRYPFVRRLNGNQLA
jgi:hypothetical protein